MVDALVAVSVGVRVLVGGLVFVGVGVLAAALTASTVGRDRAGKLSDNRTMLTSKADTTRKRVLIGTLSSHYSGEQS
jgi:hypothetical protein